MFFHRSDAAMSTTSKSSNRILLALCFCTTAGAFNFLAMSPFYPEMSSDLDVSVSVVGQIVTFMVLLSGVLGLVLGPVVDRYGFRRPLLIGLCCVSINQIGAGLAPAFPFLLGLSLVGGFGDALVFGVPFAVAGTIFAEGERKRAFSWLTGAMSLGAIVGIPVLTLIGSATNWRVALIVLGVVVIAAALFTARTLPNDRREVESNWSLRLFRASYEPLLHDAATVRLLSATAIRSICWLGFLTYLGAFLDEQHGLSTRQIGLVYTIGATGFAIGCSISGRLIGPSRTRLAVGIGCLATGLATAAAVSVSEAWLAIGFVAALAMASAVVAIGVTYLISATTPGEQGTTMLLNGSVINLGTAVGAALGGGLIALGDYRALGVGLSVFAVIGAVLVLWTQQRALQATPSLTPRPNPIDLSTAPGPEAETGASI
jgi:DHA1 family inner membrane transport protein